MRIGIAKSGDLILFFKCDDVTTIIFGSFSYGYHSVFRFVRKINLQKCYFLELIFAIVNITIKKGRLVTQKIPKDFIF